MSRMLSGHATAPYPALPAPLAQRCDTRYWRFRRFGSRGDDLQVDLTADRPTAVTEVLARCTLPEPDRDFLWDLPVGKRIECLLMLGTLDGLDAFDIDLHCPGCHGLFEVTTTAEELLEAGRAADRVIVEVPSNAGMSRFRIPTGRDQKLWLEQGLPDGTDTIAAIIATLEVDAVNDVCVSALEAALDVADPLLRAPIVSACPDCACQVEAEMDLEAFVLAHFQRSQDSLIAGIDLLASRYHWSEAEILALPEWRRVRYVNRLRHQRS